MWHAESLGASYFQGSYYPGSRNPTGIAASVMGKVHNSMAASCQRIERIDLLISGAEPLINCNMCHLCASEISRKVDSTFREVEGIRKTYKAALSKEHPSTNTIESSAKSLNVDKYLQSADSEQIAAAIYDLEQDIALLEREEKQLLAEHEQSRAEARDQSVNISILQSQIGDIEYEHSKVMERLPRVLELLDTSAREINYLRQSHDRNNPALIPSTPLFDVAVEPASRYGYINGRRLAYRALSAQNLNWSEINGSWAVVGSLLQCTRSFHDLTDCLDFSTTHCADIAAHFGVVPSWTNTEAECYSMKLRPLKDRVLLLLQVEPAVADCTVLNSPNAHQADGLNVSSASRSSVSTVDVANTSKIVIKSVRLSEVDTPFPTHNSVTKAPQGNVALASPAAKNISGSRGAPRVRQRTVHLEGGVADAHTSGSSRTPSSKNPAAFATALSNSEAEYRNAVLLLACAAVVTLLEVAKMKALHTLPRASSGHGGISGTGGSERSQGGSEVGPKLEKLFVGHMLDLACVLLICDGVCLEVPSSVGYAASSGSVAVSASANTHGSVSAKSAAAAGSRSLLPPGSPSRPQSVPTPVARSMMQSVVSRSDAKQVENAQTMSVKMERLHSYATFCDIGGSEGCSFDVLSCLLVSAGLASSDADTLMEQLVVDLLYTLVLAMGR